jgi:hypothetical protein
MATFFDALTDQQIEFIRRQHIFFVAAASAGARINLSPKGMDTFRVINPNAVAYLDMGGSGNETSAHLQNDGRITIMFCSFDQAPLILRLYGRGEVVRPRTPEWTGLAPSFAPVHGQRQIIRARINSVQDSCGYAVPRYDFTGERDTLVKVFERLTAEQIQAQQAAQVKSIDGLPIVPACAAPGR